MQKSNTQRTYNQKFLRGIEEYYINKIIKSIDQAIKKEMKQ